MYYNFTILKYKKPLFFKKEACLACSKKPATTHRFKEN